MYNFKAPISVKVWQPYLKARDILYDSIFRISCVRGRQSLEATFTEIAEKSHNIEKVISS